MNARSLETVMRLSENGHSISTQISSVLALVLCQYAPIETELSDKALRTATSHLLNPLIVYMPLDLNKIYTFLYQLHQYRKQVVIGYSHNARNSSGTLSWLFGFDTFASTALLMELSQEDAVRVYRSLSSILRDINSEVSNVSAG